MGAPKRLSAVPALLWDVGDDICAPPGVVGKVPSLYMSISRAAGLTSGLGLFGYTLGGWVMAKQSQTNRKLSATSFPSVGSGHVQIEVVDGHTRSFDGWRLAGRPRRPLCPRFVP